MRVQIPLIVIALVLLLAIGSLGYLLFSGHRLGTLEFQNPDTASTMRYGASVERVKRCPRLRTELKRCHATVLTGVTLALSRCCNTKETSVISLSVTIPPSSIDTVKTVLSTAIDKRKVSCDKDRRCKAVDKTTNLDLNLMLLESGLAIKQQGETRDTYDKAETAAREERRGLWWDWKETRPTPIHCDPQRPDSVCLQYPNPVLWRGERDVTASNADVASMTRLGGIATFSAGLLSFAVGGFLFTAISNMFAERRKRQDAREIARKYVDDLIGKARHLRVSVGHAIPEKDIAEEIGVINALIQKLKDHAQSVEHTNRELHSSLNKIINFIQPLLNDLKVDAYIKTAISSAMQKTISQKLKDENLAHLEDLRTSL